MLRLILISIILVLQLDILHSEENSGRVYTLDECIKIARQKSPAAKMARSDFRRRSLEHDAFRADYLPQLSLSGDFPGLTRQITQSYLGNEFLTQSRISSSAYLSLSQKLPFSGGTLSFSSGLYRIDQLESGAFDSWNSTPFRVSLFQPLFRSNSMAWDREIEELRNIKSDREYAEALEDIAIETTRRFFDLFIADMNVRNAEFNVAVNDTLYRISTGRYNVGKIAENDLLQSELALTNMKNSLEIARLEYNRAMEDLIINLGLEGSREISIIPPEGVPFLDVDPQLAVEQAIGNRSDIIDYKVMELQAERGVEQAEDNNGFNASLEASYGLNKNATYFSSVYKELLDQESLNLSFSVPLFQWGKGSAYIEAAREEEKSIKTSIDLQRRNFELDVRYQALRFTQLQNQVISSAKADTIATRRFDVAKNRYMIGKIDMNSLFIAQNEKDSALRSYIQTMKSYWMSLYRLRRLTLYDFDTNTPLVRNK